VGRHCLKLGSQQVARLAKSFISLRVGLDEKFYETLQVGLSLHVLGRWVVAGSILESWDLSGIA